MKILFLCPSGHLGGAEWSLLDLMASLREADASADLNLLVSSDGPLVEEARRLGVSVHRLALPAALAEIGDSALKWRGRSRAALALAARSGAASLSALRYRARLGRLVSDLRPSVLHTNDNKSHFLAAVTAGPALPVVWHLRDYVGSRPLLSKALRWCSARAAGALAISESVAADARPVLGDLPIEVIHNAIDLERFSPGEVDGRLLDQLSGLPPAPAGHVRVGLVATYGRWKGHDLFLSAAGRLVAAAPSAPVRFYIVGGPIYATRGSQFEIEELQTLVRSSRLERHVGFVGFRRDTPEIYRALDVVVHASTQPEPFGRTIVEAMACGKAVIASRAGGAAELFTPGLEAVGFTPGDAGSLERALTEMLGDEAGRRRLGANARRAAIERFGRHRLARQVLDAYGRMLRRRMPAD